MIDAIKNFESSWKNVMGDEFDTPRSRELFKFIAEERTGERKSENGVDIVFPPEDKIFAAFRATPFNDVRVVIMGQDPYPTRGHAHGLCFSVAPGIEIPRSLANIFKELKSDVAIEQPATGCLVSWAEQGVLLLNSVLTVREGEAGSHQKRGWEEFTDRAIAELSRRRQGIVFVLWGAYAQKKGLLIDRSRHFVIESVHPSPLSASRGFFGSRPFSKVNRHLAESGSQPVDWRVAPGAGFR